MVFFEKKFWYTYFLIQKIDFFEETDNIIPSLITINELSYILVYLIGLGLGQSDHIIQMITLSVITLSGFHCNRMTSYLNIWGHLKVSKNETRYLFSFSFQL